MDVVSRKSAEACSGMKVHFFSSGFWGKGRRKHKKYMNKLHLPVDACVARQQGAGAFTEAAVPTSNECQLKLQDSETPADCVT